MTKVDKLIRQYYKANPNLDADITVEEMPELHKRLYVLTTPQFQALVNHFQGTEEGRKVKKFVDEEITRVTKRLGIDEEVLLSDILTNLAFQKPDNQETIMTQPLSHMEQEVLDQAMAELEAEKGE
jgi:hypothetical protein